MPYKNYEKHKALKRTAYSLLTPTQKRQLREANKRWCKKNPDKTRLYRRRQHLKTYGLSVEEWQSMRDEQMGRCAICGSQFGSNPGNCCVDHDHDTGKLRELLCNRCNVGVGLFGEDPENLINAAEYLRRHKGS